MDLRTISKAIAGALAGLVIMLMAKYNIVIADGLPDALEVVIGALITFITVYLAPRNADVPERREP